MSLSGIYDVISINELIVQFALKTIVNMKNVMSAKQKQNINMFLNSDVGNALNESISQDNLTSFYLRMLHDDVNVI